MGRLTIFVGLLLSGVLTNVILGQEIEVLLSNDEPVSIGDDVTVHCRVKNFSPGAAAVWWKRQGAEEVRLGVNSDLDVQVGRYSLDVQQAKTSMLFFLNIRGVQPEDNGDFGCSLLDDENTKYYRNVVVSDPVQSARLLQISPDSAESIREFQDGEAFTFEDGEDYYFKCIVTGSNPIPDVAVTLGYKKGAKNLNDLFDRQDNLISDPTSGDVGFRRTNYETILTSSEPITVGWKANSQQLVCSGSVPNMEEPKSIGINPMMKIPPVIECASSRKVPIWTPYVIIRCDVFADPPLQDIRWYWGDQVNRGVSLVPGESYGLWSFTLEDGNKPDMKIARLKIDRTFVEMYVKYNLVAKNEKGIAYHQFTLKRDPANENKST